MPVQDTIQSKNMMAFLSALLCILAGAMIAKAEKSGMLSSCAELLHLPGDLGRQWHTQMPLILCLESAAPFLRFVFYMLLQSKVIHYFQTTFCMMSEPHCIVTEMTMKCHQISRICGYICRVARRPPLISIHFNKALSYHQSFLARAH